MILKGLTLEAGFKIDIMRSETIFLKKLNNLNVVKNTKFYITTNTEITSRVGS